MDPSQLIEQISVFALVLSRLAGFVVLSPFPGAWVAKRVRATLVLTLSLTVGLLVGVPAKPLPLDLALLPVAVSDFAIGLLVGGAFRFTVAAADIMAGMVSQASWLSTPTSMNPDMGGQSQVLGQASMLFALLVALGAGVHRVVLGYLLESFRVLPVGQTAHLTAGIVPFLELVGGSFDVGMRLALPVLGISLAVQTGLALVSRVAPSLQIFSVGFAVLIATGLITFMASLGAIGTGFLEHFGTLPDFLDELLLSIRGA